MFNRYSYYLGNKNLQGNFNFYVSYDVFFTYDFFNNCVTMTQNMRQTVIIIVAVLNMYSY